MIVSGFKDYFLSSKSVVQQDKLKTLLSLSTSGEQLKEDKDREAVTCPHCKDERIRANGILKGVQRYLCNGCGKNFSETTGKFWFALKKKDKINKYLYCLLSGYSNRKSAKETGVSIQTSFDWRHKLLTSFSSVSVSSFEGIVERDDLFFPISEKEIVI
jgi:transposase-like protein